MPDNTVKVARPSRWGNPYTVEMFGLPLALELFARTMRGIWTPDGIPDELTDAAYDAHTKFRARFYWCPLESATWELKDKNLACFCPLDQPCHADILLEIANR